MKRLGMLAALLAAGAEAKPLLGTTDSFVESAFCKTNKCELVSKESLGSGLIEWRYSIWQDLTGWTPNGGSDSPRKPVISVLRDGKKVISVSFVTGGQDQIFDPNGKSYWNKIALSLIQNLFSKSLSPQLLADFDWKCLTLNGTQKEMIIAGTIKGKISCVYANEGGGAARVSYRISLP